MLKSLFRSKVKNSIKEVEGEIEGPNITTVEISIQELIKDRENIPGEQTVKDYNENKIQESEKEGEKKVEEIQNQYVTVDHIGFIDPPVINNSQSVSDIKKKYDGDPIKKSFELLSHYIPKFLNHIISVCDGVTYEKDNMSCPPEILKFTSALEEVFRNDLYFSKYVRHKPIKINSVHIMEDVLNYRTREIFKFFKAKLWNYNENNFQLFKNLIDNTKFDKKSCNVEFKEIRENYRFYLFYYGDENMRKHYIKNSDHGLLIECIIYLSKDYERKFYLNLLNHRETYFKILHKIFEPSNDEEKEDYEFMKKHLYDNHIDNAFAYENYYCDFVGCKDFKKNFVMYSPLIDKGEEQENANLIFVKEAMKNRNCSLQYILRYPKTNLLRGLNIGLNNLIFEDTTYLNKIRNAVWLIFEIIRYGAIINEHFFTIYDIKILSLIQMIEHKHKSEFEWSVKNHVPIPWSECILCTQKELLDSKIDHVLNQICNINMMEHLYRFFKYMINNTECSDDTKYILCNLPNSWYENYSYFYNIRNMINLISEKDSHNLCVEYNDVNKRANKQTVKKHLLFEEIYLQFESEIRKYEENLIGIKINDIMNKRIKCMFLIMNVSFNILQLWQIEPLDKRKIDAYLTIMKSLQYFQRFTHQTSFLKNYLNSEIAEPMIVDKVKNYLKVNSVDLDYASYLPFEGLL